MKISRRTALLGATAIAAASSVPALAVTPDPLIRLSARMRRARAVFFDACAALDDAEYDYGHKKLPRWGLVNIETSQGVRYAGREEIEQYAETGEDVNRPPFAAWITPEQRDEALAELDRMEREGRARYDAVGLGGLLRAKEDARDEYDSAWETLRETPAQTVAGVFAKLRGSYLEHEIEAMQSGGEPDDALEREWVASIWRDLEALAGEARP